MQLDQLKRREFITLLGGAAVAWPLAARAQQPERMRRIGALLYPAADDPTAEASIAAFRQGLQRLGWSEGRNISIDLRWGGGDLERVRRYAAAGSGRSRPLHNVWNRPVRRNPGCGPVTPSGVDADRCARW